MKKCSVCGKLKEDNEFFPNRKNKDGSICLRGECKECHSKGEMNRYYSKKAFIDSKKTACLKCGEERLRCITFHHIDPSEKDFTIGQIRKSSLGVIENEISKCVCLCLNCHHEFHCLNNTSGLTLGKYLHSGEFV